MDAIYKTEFEHHSVKAIIVALNRWFGSKGKLPVKYFDTFIGYSDFCIDEPYVDTRVQLDGRPSHHYDGSTWDSNVDCPNRPKNAAYAAIEYLREEYGIFYSPQMEPDNDYKTKDEIKARTDSDYWFKAARERGQEIMKLRKEMHGQTKDDTDYILNSFREILDTLGIDKSNYVHMDIPSLKRYTVSEVAKAASNLDNYRGGATKFAADYSALQKEKEDLEKRVIASTQNLADILEALGVSKSCTIGQSMDFLQRHAVQRASLIKSEHDKFMRTIDTSKAIDEEMLERIMKAYGNTFDRARGAGQTYKFICDICDKYEIQKPSSDLTLEECIEDILKRYKMTLKENQDFRYEVERLYCNMTDLKPSYRMTILDILRAISEDVDDREELYNDMEAKWAKSEELRKEWVRRYESEHERANGEHKKADKYWAQVAGLQTRLKNLEDALDKAASNSVGYEALKNTLRKTLDSESRLKFERDSLAEELKKAKDAIRKQNEAILRNERLDEPDDTSGQ